MSDENGHNSNDDATTGADRAKQLALPLFVILSSWFCGVFACGVVCSAVVSPTHTMVPDQTGSFSWFFYLIWAFGVIVGSLICVYVARDVQNRYRVDRQRKESR